MADSVVFVGGKWVTPATLAKAEVLREATAWDSIGWDDGPFRIKGGRAIYDGVLYNCANNAANVKLARLEPRPNQRLAEISRYVHPDTVLEFLKV